jgi:hypothetical protein
MTTTETHQALNYPKPSIFSDARKRKLIAAHLQIRAQELCRRDPLDDGRPLEGQALADSFVADILTDAVAELNR